VDGNGKGRHQERYDFGQIIHSRGNDHLIDRSMLHNWNI
jgi:hypothetical protein